MISLSLQRNIVLLLYPHTLRLLFFLFLIILVLISGHFSQQEILSQGVLGTQVAFEKKSQVTRKETISQVMYASVTSKKYIYPTPSPTIAEKKEWGVAKQIGEHTWTMSVQSDSRMGSAGEILQALNAYRQRQGKGALAWDDALGRFAQSRSDSFHTAGSTDAHAGFTDFINNQSGFQKLGFMSLGENSSYGYQLEAVHLIEWVYAGDAPHNNNQLNSDWTHVGIGVSGVATDLIFGGRKG